MNLKIETNITSLDTVGDYIEILTDLTNLTSLQIHRLDEVKSEMLSNLTKLIELDLSGNTRINGETIRKLTNLRKLNLEENRIIADEDIECLPLRSLSLSKNSMITWRILKKLNLTELNLNKYAYRLEGDELSQNTSLTELTGEMMDIYEIGLENIAKMTNLRKLTIKNPNLIYKDYIRLTNLTHLELDTLRTPFNMSDLSRLETLIIKGIDVVNTNFRLVRLVSLSHLEINGYRFGTGEIDFRHLRNLTHLDVGANCCVNFAEMLVLKKLKRLILRNANYDKEVDIFGLTSLTSLEILDGRLRSIVMGKNDSLERLTIGTYNSDIDDKTLKGFVNLKYLSLRPLHNVHGLCFKYLENLYEVTLWKRHMLYKESIALLEVRGIKIKYLNI
ncbi:MAG: hypothetical protein Hyperionvirus42_11 [Hyperionvirus sp.]|uniref:Leucine-rich repeat protein n=1 Tax=Hyperionvirus sp. TaxID=2487770 RepID=A0A3G5AC78_9VIRU|nr:MAG: hypothetical protein Hyperionvirus42_11 [Hyperionvirus sp.]